MSQFVSTCTVTNSSKIVAVNDTDLSSIVQGDICVFGTQPIHYYVDSVNDTTDEITLTTLYTGVSASSVAITVHESFTPNNAYPYPETGDVRIANLVKESLLMIDEDIAGLNTSISNQGLAAVDEILTSSVVVDSCIIDTTRDTNPEWTHKTKYLSYGKETVPTGNYLGRYADETAARASGGGTEDWYARTGSTTFFKLSTGGGETQIYRAGQAKFPKLALALAESDRVVIYDLTTATPTMWMVFSTGTTNKNAVNFNTGASISSIAYQEGVLVVGVNVVDTGISVLNFYKDTSEVYTATASYIYKGTLSERNDGLNFDNTGTTRVIVNGLVNDVAITVLDTAPKNAFGLKEPTIAVATDAGTSVITHDGDVWDLTDSSTGDKTMVCQFIDDSLIVANRDVTTDTIWIANRGPIPTADSVYSAWRNAAYYNGPAPISTDRTEDINEIASNDNNLIFFGLQDRLSIAKQNNDDPTASLIAQITTTYNTGWMLGDIRRSLLANSKTADRSVKASTLTENGTVTESTITGSELKEYSGFSSSNYLSQAYSADLDFGTADFSVSWWFKQNANSTHESQWCRAYHTGAAWSGSGIECYTHLAGTIVVLFTDDGYATYDVITSSNTYDDGVWHRADLVRSGSTAYLYIDGILAGSATLTNAAGSLSNASATLQVGYRQDSYYPGTNLSLALLRFSATAPTTDQIKFAYETESQMFTNNCLLAGTEDGISSLDYDEVTDLLHVGTGSGRSVFSNLIRVDSEAIVSAGSQLITNGTFDSDISSWSFQANATGAWSSGTLQVTLSSTTATHTYQDIVTEAGKVYKVAADLKSTAGNLGLYAYDGPYTTTLAAAYGVEDGSFHTFELIFTAISTSTRISMGQGSDSTTYYVDNVSVTELVNYPTALVAHGEMVYNGTSSGVDAYIPALNLREQALVDLVSDKDSDDSEWKDMTLENNWVNYGSTWSPAQYRKDSNGFVHTRIMIKNGSTGAGITITTLPVGYRPKYNHMGIARSDSAGDYKRVDVNTVGQIKIADGVSSSGWLWIDFAPFQAEQ